MAIKNVGIIGYGDFGRFLHALAQEKFPEISVKISSRGEEPDGKTFFPLEDACRTDVLFLAVPISAFEEVVARIKPLLAPTTLVVDVATVKKHTAEVLRKQGIARFISTHPMFGPYSYAKQGNSLRELRIAVCDSSLPQNETDGVTAFLKEAQLKVLELTSDEHDKLIAETLFLTHLVGQTVKKGGFERTAIDTLSFGFLMDAVESVAHDDALFRDVFKYNPYCRDVLTRFEGAEKNVSSSLQ